MPPLQHLGAAELRDVVTQYRDALRAHQDAINRLNVYPVPDGDTGTNMALTLEAVVAELDGAGPDMAATCKAISHGSLMGARGNSGVILSQVLRGLASTLAPHDRADGSTLAAGLTAASAAAYEAVMRPVEGTILTVAREAAEAATARAADGGTLEEVLDAGLVAGHVALDHTPDLLAVLRDAGVVDAGGAGYLLLLDAALSVVAGRPLPEPAAGPARVAADNSSVDEAHAALSGLRYEVMYFLEAPDETIPVFKDVWAGIGDSIVVVGGDGLWNCHIHTDDIGAAVEAALDCGVPRKIRVTDLQEQVDEERWVREAAIDVADPPGRDLATGVVAVATGDGIRRIFRSLGVHSFVTGGQTMNPSTAQLLQAAEATPAGEIVILPNNKNIIPVAEQVDGLTDKKVLVVPTRGVAEGFAALLAYDPDAGAEANAEAMRQAAASVVAGEVTRAVRDSTCDVGPIAEGDWLGIGPTGIRAVQSSLSDAVTALVGDLVTDEHEIMTLIEGQGATAADTRRITERVADRWPHVTVEVHHGGQPLYPYLLGLE